MNLNKKTLALIILASTLLSTSITYAATSLIAQRQVINTVSVSLPRDIQLYSDTGCTTLLTSIVWGDLQRGDVIVYGETDPSMYIKNVGEATVDLNYTVSGLPAGLSLSARKLQGTWSNWNSDVLITLAPNEKMPVEWTLAVAEDAPELTASFEIHVLGWKP